MKGTILKPCPFCDGHGTMPSDYNWALEPCPECNGVAMVPRTWLDDLTEAVTAFSTWNGLMFALSRGYCPTIRVSTRRGKRLARIMKGRGLPVYYRM